MSDDLVRRLAFKSDPDSRDAAIRIQELEVENARLREYYEAAMADNARLREYYEARESLDRCILFQESGLIACQKRFASAWSVMQETDK